MVNSSYRIGLVGPYACVLDKKNLFCACRPQSVVFFLACLRFVSLFFVVESSGALLRRYFSFSFLSNGIMTGDKRRDQQQNWTRRVATLLRDMGSDEKWPHILGTVTKSRGVCPVPPPEPNLPIPEVYLDFFSKRLGFAISPNKGRRRLPLDS